MYTKLLLCFIALLGLSTCSNSDSNAKFSQLEAGNNYTVTENLDKNTMQAPSTMAPPSPPSTEKKIIRTADIAMEVKDFAIATTQIHQVIKDFDGTISNEDTEKSHYRIENKLRIRVPPSTFDTLINRITALGAKVNRKQISSQDVSKQYYDLETRLGSKRKVIERYQALLGQAKTVEEILAVEEHLRVVIEEVESTEAQLKYLQNQVGLSTIIVKYHQSIEYDDTSSAPTFFERCLNSFSYGWYLIQEIMLGVFSLWPIWLLMTPAIWWFRRRRKRK